METIPANKSITKSDFYQKIFSASGMEEKRSILKELSATAKTMMEFSPDVDEGRVNDVILEHMYKGDEHTEFHTFKGWKELGFTVKKGSKAFFIWSQPRKVNKKIEDAKEDETQDKQYKMYGIAHLFSNAQVEPIDESTD